MKVNAKYVVFSLIGVMSLYVLYHNERFLVDPNHPAWQHYESFKWWLLPHGIFGAIVLLFAPFQFSERIRKRFTRAHQILGRVYVVGALIMAPLGAYIQYYQQRMGAPHSFTVLGIVDATMVMSTALLAFLFAYKRKIALHRQWATRSYAIALVFIAARFVLGVTGFEKLGVEMVQAMIWSCLALSVLLADVAINWREMRTSLSAQVIAPVSKKQTVPSGVRAA